MINKGPAAKAPETRFITHEGAYGGEYGGGYGADMRRGGEMSELDLKLSATQDWRSRSLRGF